MALLVGAGWLLPAQGTDFAARPAVRIGEISTGIRIDGHLSEVEQRGSDVQSRAKSPATTPDCVEFGDYFGAFRRATHTPTYTALRAARPRRLRGIMRSSATSPARARVGSCQSPSRLAIASHGRDPTAIAA